MSADGDPKGYYRILGLASNASQAQIVHAYREWAKKYHPDAGQRESSSDFIRITEAYETLSDPTRRQRYDADVQGTGAKDSTSAQTSSGGTQNERASDSEVAAVRCCSCGVITAQPRYCVFDKVFSFVFVTRVEKSRGIYCVGCAKKKSIRESAVCWLFGWWSVIGIVETPIALWRNLCLGEHPRADNARILIFQALYFVDQRNFDLAHSCLDQAKEFADAEALEVLASVRNAIPLSPTKTLRNLWKWQTAFAGIHIAPLAIAIATLIWFGYFSQIAVKQAATTSLVKPSTPLKTVAADIRYVAVPEVTAWSAQGSAYVRNGLLPQFSTVQVLGPAPDPKFVIVQTSDRHTVTVEAAALVPGTGAQAKSLWCSQQTQSPPMNNAMLTRTMSGRNQVTIKNLGNYDAVAKFRSPDKAVAIAFYVAAQSQAMIGDFPDGSFRLEFATGHDWSWRCKIFMRDMSAQRFPTFDDFISTETRAGVRYRVAEYTITPVLDGNVRTDPLDVDAFLSDGN
jgi:DnaJ domain